MVLVLIDNKINSMSEYLQLARAFCEAGSKDRGCIEMNVYTDPDRPNRAVFVTKWETKEDFLAQTESPAFKEYIPKMEPYLECGDNTILELA